MESLQNQKTEEQGHPQQTSSSSTLGANSTTSRHTEPSHQAQSPVNYTVSSPSPNYQQSSDQHQSPGSQEKVSSQTNLPLQEYPVRSNQSSTTDVTQNPTQHESTRVTYSSEYYSGQRSSYQPYYGPPPSYIPPFPTYYYTPRNVAAKQAMESLENQKTEEQGRAQQTSSSTILGANSSTSRHTEPSHQPQSPKIYFMLSPIIYHHSPGQQQSRASPQKVSSQTDLPLQEYPAQSNQPSTAVVPQNPTQHESTRVTYSSEYYSGQRGSYQPYYGPPPGYPAPYPTYYYKPRNVADSPMVTENPSRRPTEEPVEAPRDERFTGFDDKEIRAKFVRKVYIILMLQLLFTVGNIALFIYEPNVKRFVQENGYLVWVALAIFFCVYLGLICYQNARRSFPLNFICLMIFTVAFSYFCSTLSTFYNTDSVLMAAGICAAVCIVVTILSFYTKFDVTACGPLLCILLVLLFLFGLIAIFFPNMVMRMLYAGLGATLFTMMLAYNTQMMLGGKRYQLSPEEYIFAALQIYLDIVYIFIFCLMLTGAGDT